LVGDAAHPAATPESAAPPALALMSSVGHPAPSPAELAVRDGRTTIAHRSVRLGVFLFYI